MSIGLASDPMPRRFALLAPEAPAAPPGPGVDLPLALRVGGGCGCWNSALHAEHLTRRFPMNVGGTRYSTSALHLLSAREAGGTHSGQSAAMYAPRGRASTIVDMAARTKNS